MSDGLPVPRLFTEAYYARLHAVAPHGTGD